jgi:hypothetical protein
MSKIASSVEYVYGACEFHRCSCCCICSSAELILLSYTPFSVPILSISTHALPLTLSYPMASNLIPVFLHLPLYLLVALHDTRLGFTPGFIVPLVPYDVTVHCFNSNFGTSGDHKATTLDSIGACMGDQLISNWCGKRLE